MAVVWCRELPKERSQSGKYKETYEFTRAWIVRVDDPATALPDITNATGIAYKDPHPDDGSCVALEFTTQASDDSGLLFVVRVKYYTLPVDQGEGNEEQPGQIPGLMRSPVWSGSSSVVSVPIFKDKAGDIITNSAGDPLEGLEAEAAEFRLSLTMYFLGHTGWASLGRQYTNAVNSDTWNGGAPKTWKCQGCSAQLQTENKEGTSFIFWETAWEFAYRADGWNLMPWDVGFHERVDSSGTPTSSGTNRRVIVGQDKKGVRQPVALANGIALPPGTPPEVINGGAGVEVYQTAAFGAVFGELYTPTVPDE